MTSESQTEKFHVMGGYFGLTEQQTDGGIHEAAKAGR